jgi:hypothetical protein
MSFVAPPEPKFTAQDLDPKIEIGYSLAIADVDGDGKLDIVASGRGTKNVKIYRNAR